MEGDEILDGLGGDTYLNAIKNSLNYMEDNYEDFFSKRGLLEYSPKFLTILSNIKEIDYYSKYDIYNPI